MPVDNLWISACRTKLKMFLNKQNKSTPQPDSLVTFRIFHTVYFYMCICDKYGILDWFAKHIRHMILALKVGAQKWQSPRCIRPTNAPQWFTGWHHDITSRISHYWTLVMGNRMYFDFSSRSTKRVVQKGYYFISLQHQCSKPPCLSHGNRDVKFIEDKPSGIDVLRHVLCHLCQPTDIRYNMIKPRLCLKKAQCT